MVGRRHIVDDQQYPAVRGPGPEHPGAVRRVGRQLLAPVADRLEQVGQHILDAPALGRIPE